MRSVSLAMFCLLLALAFHTSALEALQDDWSGGGGVPGPVTDWGDQFDTSTTVDWSGSPGELALGFAVQDTLVSDATVQPNCVVAAFVDADTDLDLICSAADIVWYENSDGSGNTWISEQVADTVGVQYMAPADIDGDDDTDFFYGTWLMSGSAVMWMENVGSGSSWVSHSVGSGGASSVFAVDLDEDNDVDLIASLGSSGELAWWSNDDGVGGGWTKHTIASGFAGVESVIAIDLDGDSDLDVVAAANEGDEVAWWSNDDGAGTSWTKHSIYVGFDGATSVYAADIDGDTDIDVAATALIGDQLAWWSNDDGVGGAWSMNLVEEDFGGANSVVAVDVDGDSDTDLVAAGMGSYLAWWENVNGSGTTMLKHELASDFRGAWFVDVGDFNGDERDDVVCCAGFDNEVRWWNLFAQASSGDLTSSILDVSSDGEWGWVLWDSTAPAGTGVVLSVRASDDAGSMGSWSTVDWGADLGESYPTMRDYLQYRVGLSTTDPQVSPVFSSFDVCPYFHLVSPANGSVVDTLTPTLDWDDTVVPDFDTYTLWWGTDPAFGTYTEVANLVDSTYRITLGIADGDVIYWRVKALDSSSNEFWAPEKGWSFTVDLDFDVELAYLSVRSEDEGVLVGWSFEGEVPAGMRVLREVDGEITPLHRDALPGTATRFLDRDIEVGVEYRYWLEVVTSEGVTSRFGPTESVTVVEDAPELVLYAAYPNPSREVINFVFSIPDDGCVVLSVYDLAGRRVATPIDSELTAGRHEATWNCAEIPSGVYLYRLETTAGSLTQRLVIGR